MMKCLNFGEYHMCSKKDMKYSITALGFHSVGYVSGGNNAGYTSA